MVAGLQSYYGGLSFRNSEVERWHVYQRVLEGSPTATFMAGGAAPALNLNEAKGEYGNVIPISMGTRRMSPQLIWSKAIYGSEAGGYFCDFAVSWGYNGDTDPSATEIIKLYANGTLIWANGSAVMPGGWAVTLYSGTEDQLQDPTLVSHLGAANVPAYRNQLYGVFTGFPIGPQFGYSVPGISAEISGALGAATTLNEVDEQIVVTGGTVAEYATTTTGNPAPALGDTTYNTGKKYFEVVMTDVAPSGVDSVIVGVVTPDFVIGIDDYLDISPYAVAIEGGTSAYVASGMYDEFGQYTTDPDNNPNWDTGTVVCIAVDFDAGLMWWRLDNGAWSGWLDPGLGGLFYEGDPAAGTYGLPYADIHPAFSGATFRPAVELRTEGEIITAQFAEGDLSYTPPTGFVPWGGTGGGSPGSITLPNLIRRVAEYAKMDPDADLSFDAAITDSVAGALIASETTFGDFSSNLGRWFGFDLFEGATIHFVKPVDGATYAVDRAVPSIDLLNNGDRAVTTTRGEDMSPVLLEGQYIDQTQQFRYNTQRARRILFPTPSTQSTRQESMAVPVIQTANQAISYLGQAIYRMAAQNVVHAFATGPRHFDIEPGDILGITAGDTAYEVKVTGMEIGADLRVSLTAVNLFTNEDIELVGDSGSPLGDFANDPVAMEVTFTAASGSLTIGGQAAGILHGFTTLSANQGSVAIAGQAAAFNTGLSLLAASGSFAVTGQTAMFNLNIGAAYGSMVINGQAAAFSLLGERYTSGGDLRITSGGDTRFTA